MSDTAAARARAILESHAEKAALRLTQIVDEEKHPRNYDAILATLDRSGVHAKASIETTGSQQIVIERRIVDPTAD